MRRNDKKKNVILICLLVYPNCLCCDRYSHVFFYLKNSHLQKLLLSIAICFQSDFFSNSYSWKVANNKKFKGKISSSQRLK